MKGSFFVDAYSLQINITIPATYIKGNATLWNKGKNPNHDIYIWYIPFAVLFILLIIKNILFLHHENDWIITIIY